MDRPTDFKVAGTLRVPFAPRIGKVAGTLRVPSALEFWNGALTGRMRTVIVKEWTAHGVCLLPCNQFLLNFSFGVDSRLNGSRTNRFWQPGHRSKRIF